jgi:hypothetical protein
MSKKQNNNLDLVNDLKSILERKTYEAVDNSVLPGSSLYEVEPVDILTFVESKDYLGINLYGLSNPQRKVLEIADNFENLINYIILWVGKGGGKDFITRVIFMRLVYKLLCMRNPHKFFGIPSSEIITFLNVAASADQATSVFFDPLKNYIRSAGSKAFLQFGFDPSKDIKDRYIVFPKNIHLVSGHSESDSLEGKNILVGVVDEIDADTFRNPDKMWTMLRSSSRSRFNGKEKIFAISYMRYSGSNGMIKKLHNDYEKDKNAFVAKYPTWEFNPRNDITKDTFRTEFERNPVEAETIYACNPPEQAIDAWFKDVDRLKKALKSQEFHPLDFSLPSDDFYKNPKSESITYKNGEYITLNPYDLPFKQNFVGKEGVDYVLVADPGLGRVSTEGDAYAIALGHREYYYSREGKLINRPVIDFVFRFTGYMFSEEEIQISAVHNLIEKLTDKLNFKIKYFFFDIYNSASTAQWLQRKYTDSKVIYNKYVTYENYSLLRERIFGEAASVSGDKLDNGGISLYYHPILYWEMINLIEDREKKKVDHKPDTSKDMADTVAILTNLLVNLPLNTISIVGAPRGLINDISNPNNISLTKFLSSELNQIVKEEESKFAKKLFGTTSVTEN